MIEKRHIKGEKDITRMNFAEHLRKSDVSENGKVYYGRFLQNGLHERIQVIFYVYTRHFDNFVIKL